MDVLALMTTVAQLTRDLKTATAQLKAALACEGQGRVMDNEPLIHARLERRLAARRQGTPIATPTWK